MRILGIDPGINGACALYCPRAPVPTVPGGIFDIPTVGEGPDREIDYVQLRNLIWRLKPHAAFIERVTAMPSIPGKGGVRRDMGAASAFKFGGAYYAIKAVVACLDIPQFKAAPVSWKKLFPVGGGDASKEKSRLHVIQRWPAVAPFLKRKLDHQRAEAFLIAVWGSTQWKGPIPEETETVQPEPSPGLFDGQ